MSRLVARSKPLLAKQTRAALSILVRVPSLVRPGRPGRRSRHRFRGSSFHHRLRMTAPKCIRAQQPTSRFSGGLSCSSVIEAVQLVIPDDSRVHAGTSSLGVRPLVRGHDQLFERCQRPVASQRGAFRRRQWRCWHAACSPERRVELRGQSGGRDHAADVRCSRGPTGDDAAGPARRPRQNHQRRVSTALLAPDSVKALKQTGLTPSNRWLYPYANTVFPRGLPAPVLQWDGPSPDAIYLHISSMLYDYQGCLTLAAARPELRDPAGQPWDAAGMPKSRAKARSR